MITTKEEGDVRDVAPREANVYSNYIGTSTSKRKKKSG